MPMLLQHEGGTVGLLAEGIPTAMGLDLEHGVEHMWCWLAVLEGHVWGEAGHVPSVS